MSDNIRISTEARVTTITIDRVDKKNAITQDMYGAMADAIVHYGDSDDARALVITGVGNMFTAGNDLGDFVMGTSEADIPPVGRFLNAIRDCPKPLIAAVNGHAIGVGLTMLLHCDLVYCSEGATFSAPFVPLGVVPEAGSSVLLPAVVGMALANDIVLTGRRLSAAEAEHHGLVARVFSDDEFEPAMHKVALAVAGSAPTSMRRAKALMRHNRDFVAQQMNQENRWFADQLAGPEFAEAMAAMKGKRAQSH
ncbi:MAG: enoyl-CoA hydratase-related protein [Pseudomonadota bacterium]